MRKTEKTQTVAPAGFVLLTLKYRQEEDEWVGVCEELGTAAQACSLEEVMGILRELVELDLNTLEEMGQRENFFRERGIRFYACEPTTVRQTVELERGELASRQVFRVACS